MGEEIRKNDFSWRGEHWKEKMTKIHVYIYEATNKQNLYQNNEK